MITLPKEWIGCTFEECNTFQSKTLDPALFGDETFELYSVPSFPSGTPEFVKGRDIGSTKQLVQQGDVLVCKINPRINRVWQVKPSTAFRQIASSEWIVMRSPDLNANYLMYYFGSPDFRELICEGVTGVGGSLTRAQPQNVATFPIPLAPLIEQKRIADELDIHLAQVDFCRESLDRIPELIKRFRQTVLDDATSGRLTEDWRMSVGITHQWQSFKLSEIGTSRLGKMLDKAKNQGNLTPYLRNTNVRWFGFDLSDIQTLRVTTYEAQELAVKVGDILICEGGEPGRCAIWRDESNKYVYQKALHRFRVNKDVMPEWVCYSLKHANDSGRLSDLFTGTTIKHLTGVSLANFDIDIPSFQEQVEIVRRVENLFDFADQLEARLQALRSAVERVIPAMLAKAFRGELVPQDPNDEPASVLLERIQKARAEQQHEKKRAPRTPSPVRTKVVAKTLQEIAPTHLTDTLLENGGKLTPEELLRLSELTLDDFYTQIKREMKTIRDVRPDEQTRFLEAIS